MKLSDMFVIIPDVFGKESKEYGEFLSAFKDYVDFEDFEKQIVEKKISIRVPENNEQELAIQTDNSEFEIDKLEEKIKENSK